MTMKKSVLFLCISICLFSITACSVKQSKYGEEATPPPTAIETPQVSGQGTETTPAPTTAPKEEEGADYSMSTMLPDGSERVEGTYLGDVDNSTILVKSIGGERKIKITSTVRDHIGKLKIEKGNNIILIIKDGVANSVEKVVS